MTTDSQPTPTRAAIVLQVLRAAVHLLSVGAVAVWGFLSWPLPFPGILTGFGLMALAVLLWALFLSPRPVLRTDRYAVALFELLLIAGAVGALLGLGVWWPIPAAFGLFGAVLGYISSATSA